MKRQILALVGVAALAGGLAYAQNPPAAGPRGDRPERRGPLMLKQELGLSDAQMAQIDKLHTDQQLAAIKRRADIQTAQIQLRELLKASAVDDKAVSALVKQLGDLHAAQIRARVDMQLQMKKILTPEQQEKLKELRASRPGRPGQGRGTMRGPMFRRQQGPPRPDRPGTEDPRPLTDSDGR
jgi:Spy/CpxP family protein refolding chaperone